LLWIAEKNVKEIADKRAEYERTKELSKSQKVTLEDLSAVIAEGNPKKPSCNYQNRCPRLSRGYQSNLSWN